MFDLISKRLKVRQKYSVTFRVFNSLLRVWKCGQTQSFVFVQCYCLDYHSHIALDVISLPTQRIYRYNISKKNKHISNQLCFVGIIIVEYHFLVFLTKYTLRV